MDNEKKYAVVETIENAKKLVSIVPQSWLILKPKKKQENVVRYPRVTPKNNKFVQESINNCALIDQKHGIKMKLYDCIILSCEIDTLNEAKAVEEKYRICDTSCNEDGDVSQKKENNTLPDKSNFNKMFESPDTPNQSVYEIEAGSKSSNTDDNICIPTESEKEYQVPNKIRKIEAGQKRSNNTDDDICMATEENQVTIFNKETETDAKRSNNTDDDIFMAAEQNQVTISNQGTKTDQNRFNNTDDDICIESESEKENQMPNCNESKAGEIACSIIDYDTYESDECDDDKITYVDPETNLIIEVSNKKIDFKDKPDTQEKFKNCNMEEKLDMIWLEVKTSNLLLKELLAKSGNDTKNEYHIDDEFENFFKTKLPAKNQNDILMIENKIKQNIDFKTKLTKRLSESGGLTDKLLCLRIMDNLFAPISLTEMSWIGTEKKAAFKSLPELLNIIINAIKIEYSNSVNIPQLVENALRQRCKNAEAKVVSDAAKIAGLPNPRNKKSKTANLENQ